MKKRVLSGMRPTGKLHLGHLLGALGNWKKLQEQYDCLFMVADWHALMSEYENPKKIAEYSIDNVIDWIACGIDPERSTIFIQSKVDEHLELAMILGNLTPLSWLERCPTYKEQLRELKGRELTTYGFLGYPVLQTADILLYKAEAVPVGEDQLAHLELAREILRRFHHLYKKSIFPEPEAMLTQVPRLLGTDNRKMSKSYDNFIALSDSKEAIQRKVLQMITDPQRIRLSDPGHPDICNVFSYYKIFKPEQAKIVEAYCKGAKTGCTECKKNLAETLIEYLSPIQQKRKELVEDRKKLENILGKGNEKARKIAQQTMQEVRKLIGIHA